MAVTPTFIFGGNTGVDYNEAQRRRAMAAALAKGVYNNQPRNAVEGMGAVAEALAARYQAKKATDMEQQGRAQASEQFNAMIAANGMDPAKFAGADNPYMTDSQRAVVNAMIGQQFKTPDKPNVYNMGGRLVDETGRVVYEEPQQGPEYNVLTDDEEKAMGLDPAPTYQRGRDGKVDVISKPSSDGMTVYGPDGQPIVTTGNAKPMTEAQSKDTVYATRAAGAMEAFEPFADQLTSFSDTMGGSLPVVGNYLKSEEYQMAEQAGREFLAPILRKDTGAAITQQEMQIYGEMYLPQPGDSKGVLAYKKAARARAVAALEAGMTPQAMLAKERALQKLGGEPPRPEGPQPGTIEDGYRFKGGDPADPANWEQVS